jgi:hypothetical protein
MSFCTLPSSPETELPNVIEIPAVPHRLVYVILAEDRLVLSEAQAPQPDHNVHDGAHKRGCGHDPREPPRCPGWIGSQIPLRSIHERLAKRRAGVSA